MRVLFAPGLKRWCGAGVRSPSIAQQFRHGCGSPIRRVDQGGWHRHAGLTRPGRAPMPASARAGARQGSRSARGAARTVHGVVGRESARRLMTARRKSARLGFPALLRRPGRARMFAKLQPMPGPTGGKTGLAGGGRQVCFVCILSVEIFRWQFSRPVRRGWRGNAVIASQLKQDTLGRPPKAGSAGDA